MSKKDEIGKMLHGWHHHGYVAIGDVIVPWCAVQSIRLVDQDKNTFLP